MKGKPHGEGGSVCLSWLLTTVTHAREGCWRGRGEEPSKANMQSCFMTADSQLAIFTSASCTINNNSGPAASNQSPSGNDTFVKTACGVSASYPTPAIAGWNDMDVAMCVTLHLGVSIAISLCGFMCGRVCIFHWQCPS